MKQKKWTKVALAFSCCLFVFWWALGTGATLAWFSDVEIVRNEFRVGNLDLEVSYRNPMNTQYADLQGVTQLFNDQAVYEPGYTQVVYLKIENKGNVDFKYKVAVTVEDFDNGINAWGGEIYLPDHLKYGVVFAETEAELKLLVGDRLQAREYTSGDWGALGTWSQEALKSGSGVHYAALIVCMPEEVTNVANYRGKAPSVELGVTVYAQQANAPTE